MQISENAWHAYVRNLSKVDARAAELMEKWIARNGTGDLQALIDYAYAISTRYGEGAAALACEMYDSIAKASGVEVPPAVPAETVSYGEVTAAAKRIIDVDQTPDQMPKAVERFTKRAAADTTLKNAERDGAQFAWVPHGDTCAFCIVLASRGWQYMSSKALRNGHAEHIHNNCDCEYAVRFNDNTSVKGYDPDKYLHQYESAEGSTPQERINSMRRAQYAADPEKYRAQKRAVYARSKEFISVLHEYETNAEPGKGKVEIQGRRELKNREKENAELLHSNFGGDIVIPEETNIPGRKNPDYIWKGKSWEEQEPKAYTANAIDANIREAIHQIIDNPGGVVLDIGNSDMKLSEVKELTRKRLQRSSRFNCDIIIIRNGKIEDVMRYRKIKK